MGTQNTEQKPHMKRNKNVIPPIEKNANQTTIMVRNVKRFQNKNAHTKMFQSTTKFQRRNVTRKPFQSATMSHKNIAIPIPFQNATKFQLKYQLRSKKASVSGLTRHRRFFKSKA